VLLFRSVLPKRPLSCPVGVAQYPLDSSLLLLLQCSCCFIFIFIDSFLCCVVFVSFYAYYFFRTPASAVWACGHLPLEIRPGLALRQPPAVEVAPLPSPDPAHHMDVEYGKCRWAKKYEGSGALMMNSCQQWFCLATARTLWPFDGLPGICFNLGPVSRQQLSPICSQRTRHAAHNDLKFFDCPQRVYPPLVTKCTHRPPPPAINFYATFPWQKREKTRGKLWNMCSCDHKTFIDCKIQYIMHSPLWQYAVAQTLIYLRKHACLCARGVVMKGVKFSYPLSARKKLWYFGSER